MGIRVLFLHQLEAGPGTLKHKYLELSFDVECPQLGAATWMMRLRVLLGAIIALLIALWAAIWTVWALMLRDFGVWLPIVATIIVLFLLVVLFLGLKRLFLWCMLREAVKAADEAFEQFEPDIIVGHSFGTVVALHMKRSRKSPLLLLSPANHLFHWHAGFSEAPNLSSYPVVTLVHGDNDATVPVADSIRLEATSKQAHLERIPHEDHRLGSLGQFELREYVHSTLFKVDRELVNSSTWAVPPADYRQRRPSSQGSLSSREGESARELRQGRGGGARRPWPARDDPPELALEGSGRAE